MNYGFLVSIYLASISKNALGQLRNYLNVLFYEYGIWENIQKKIKGHTFVIIVHKLNIYGRFMVFMFIIILK